ncbi:hypothetical protein FBU30_006346 [Linnemannia zychae]|nr:hypothetical protein FBU30_006346 [Linnemannia zychae]
MVALMAPILLTTIQATPVSLLETPSPAIEEGYKVTSPSVSPTSTKKITKTAPTISPSPFPDGTQPIQPDKASSVTTASVMFPTPTDNSVHDNPSISDIASLGQARTGTTPTDGLDSSAYLSESIANSNYGAIGSLPTMGLPNSSLTPPSTQTKHSTSPTTMVMVSLGSVAAVIIVVVGALTIRRRLKNRRDLQDEDDFDGIGAYASGKKSRYVGLTSFGSTTSSGSGPEIKKPPPLAQHEQFWNP